ncbi:Cytochrome c oxidase subunit 5A [Physocladia obscura]|uniref:Cytochrome c oxidase subunit 5A n=1 Tax=Physocladia obscura TaxID=109957 RepID=A0AAD5TBG6_9FUNG|nr:Cytochrome c oxidase subunit 5A [Physocladia obscura]
MAFRGVSVGLRSLNAAKRHATTAAGNALRATEASIRGLETRWGKLPEAEQGAIADRIAAAEKADWKAMSLEEKRAAYFIAYGAHGARNQKDPNLTKAVWSWVALFIGISGGIFAYWETRELLQSESYHLTDLTKRSNEKTEKPQIRTMTPEWKAAEDARAIELKQNPFQGAYAKVRKEQEKNSTSN